MNESKSPQSVVESIAGGLTKNDNTYSLDTKSKELLQQLNGWAMLLDSTGHVSWSFDLPNQIPQSYSLVDIAQLSRNYLMDYPVFVWEHNDGLIVIGYPKNSLAKYQFSFPFTWVSELPLRVLALFAVNVLLALLLSLLIGSKLIKSIKPLITGIHALSDEKPVDIETTGIFSDLAMSINHTSLLLQKKNSLLKARDEARSNWIAGISHDIRTPLSMVLGYSSELEENEILDDEYRKQASIIRQQAQKLGSLVNDLNLVSMLEYEMQPLDLKPIRLSAIARQIATEFLNGGLDEKYAIELDLTENLFINGDKKLFIRAITNLVQNSITHNPQGCQICIQTTMDETNCHFVVIDNGKGISKSEIPNLTELPYSSKRKNNVYSGHGLGLPMVARIAKAHDGLLILTSDTGKGMKADIVLKPMPN